MEEIIKRFRVDTLKLSTEDMPIAESDGTTCYEVDTMKFYIYYKGEWYLQEPTEDETEPTEDETEPTEPTEPTENNTESR